MLTRTRAVGIFVLLCILATLAVLMYAEITRRSVRSSAEMMTMIDEVPDGPVVMFRHGGPGEAFGRLALQRLPIAGTSASAGNSSDPRALSPLSCERLHYAAGVGICLVADESTFPVRYEAFLFDRHFQRRGATIALTGPPIRARVSPDGRRAALTVFESGHSYADASFSTRTTIVNAVTGEPLGDLESFAVRKNDVPFAQIDFNFWGVTFARDGDAFFATLKTSGARYLVKGSVDARAMTVVRPGVECPSLSPDERLIVFKKPQTMRQEVRWRLFVLDLASGVERPLNRLSRSIDDQVDWYDNAHIVYQDAAPDGAGVWMLAVDDASAPQLLLRDAYSPAVQR